MVKTFINNTMITTSNLDFYLADDDVLLLNSSCSLRGVVEALQEPS